jgi:VanZ family protein
MMSKHIVRRRIFQRLIIISAWASIVALAFATLTHVGFVYSIYYKLAPLLMRPGMRLYAHFVHVVVFAVFGALFAFAYPRRVIFVCSIVFISAVALEYLQTLTPDRHGRLVDAFEKAAGGALGIAAAHAILWFSQGRRRFRN